MIHTVIKIIQIISTLGALTGAGYYVVCLWSAWVYLREVHATGCENSQAGLSLPAVSILKPLKGVDPQIYENFRSHCDQDYPADYEILFGVSEADDPAIETVRRLQSEFPQRKIQLVVCSEKLGVNVKVSNLLQMLRVARYDCLIVNDSDIRVEPGYLRRVVAPLNDPDIGMVTCLYRGSAAATFGSVLEALGIATDFCPSVLVARTVEGGVHFGLGSTLVFRRRDLEAIGGFESLLDYLADDYELGKRIGDLGRRVVLSEVIVETLLPPYTLAQFLQHQLRWARGVRDSRKWGYVGLVVTFGLPWALLSALLYWRDAWAWGMFVLVALLRFAVAFVVGHKILAGRHVSGWLPLVPVRDLIALLIWAASFVGNTVDWRGDSFTLRNGRLFRANSSG
jgi:ceramide glucosyltransferase